MSNTFFRFKQFLVNQDLCAMKVTTDACILGAWAQLPAGTKHVLDVGAGTGLLALFLAQRFPEVRIDGIELNADAARQAALNAVTSPWADRIRIINEDVISFLPESLYDAIITNPPFFKNSLLGPDSARNAARHDMGLDDRALLAVADKCLKPEGVMIILLPVTEFALLEQLFEQSGWWNVASLRIQNQPDKPVKRIVAVFSRDKRQPVVSELIIRDEANVYTAAFRELLREFYLDF